MPSTNITKGDVSAALERIERAAWSDDENTGKLVESDSFDHLRTAIVMGAELLADALVDDLGEMQIAKRKSRIIAKAGLIEVVSALQIERRGF